MSRSVTNTEVKFGTLSFYMVAALSVCLIFHCSSEGNLMSRLPLRWLWREWSIYRSLPYSTLTNTSNKWVLNTTSVPLFFLLTQLVIAIFLFILSHIFGLLKLPFRVDLELCKGLAPMIILNVVGLRFVSIDSFISSG